MTKSSEIERRAMPHWMVRRSLPDSSNSMRVLVRAFMVTLKSISEGLTLSEDKRLDLRLTDGAQDVGLVDASIRWPMRPLPLHVSVAQVEDHSHPH